MNMSAPAGRSAHTLGASGAGLLVEDWGARNAQGEGARGRARARSSKGLQCDQVLAMRMRCEA